MFRRSSGIDVVRSRPASPICKGRLGTRSTPIRIPGIDPVTSQPTMPWSTLSAKGWTIAAMLLVSTAGATSMSPIGFTTPRPWYMSVASRNV